MNTHEYAVVTEKTLLCYRNSGFEAGNIFHIQSRTECKDGITHINLIVGNEGLIKGYQERFFDIKEAYRRTPEEMASKRLTAALWELYECLPDKEREVLDKRIESGTANEYSADFLAIVIQEFIGEHSEEMQRVVEKRTEQLRHIGPMEEVEV